jgi:16S rRNA (uracil1498-N3)-methyltransferase
MPSYRFFTENSLEKDLFIQFNEDEYKHIIKVMRLEKNDILEIVNGKGFLATANIEKIDKTSVTCRIQSVHKELQHKPKFIIAQSLLRPASLELICEKNTELGVLELWFFPAELSDKQDLSHNQLERLHRHMISALKQSGRLFLPSLRFFSSLQEVLMQKNVQFLYGDLSMHALKMSTILNGTQVPVFLIGPEKGFTEEENALLSKSATGVTLGVYTLKAETASIAASCLLSNANS